MTAEPTDGPTRDPSPGPTDAPTPEPDPITSVLSDGTIVELVDRGRIRIDPWSPEHVQPASVDLRLGDSFRVFTNHRVAAIDLQDVPDKLTEEVVVPEGGEFVIHPGEFCLGRTLEWVELPDDIVARIEGKALALDTPVPTPDGWRTMGDLGPGDWVFDVEGHPTPVVAASEVMVGRPCRTVEFSDGTTVVADLDHLWQTWTKHDRTRRGRPSVLTTGEIERTLKYSATEYNHHVAQALPVRYPDRELPIDPHVLGDGTSTKAEITSIDRPMLDQLVLAGEKVAASSGPMSYRIGGVGHTRDSRTGRYMDEPLSSRRRELGVLGNEHIPREYLEAGIEQRHAMLAAILDTDGHVDVQTRGGVTTVTRAITAVRECESVPVRCIQVASPDGVFLASRSFIPTHNSSLGRLGLIVHATAGFCDPGWKGTLTLELNNLTRVPIILHPGLEIAQLSFMTLDRPALRPYGSPELGSHYQGQRAATASRYRTPRSGR